MNTISKWFAIPAAWLAASALSAAPIPSRPPTSQGPISDALVLRTKVPTTAAPEVKKVAMSDEATVEVHSRVMVPTEVTETVNQTEYVTTVRERVVQRDGRDVKVVEPVSVPVTRQVMVKKLVMAPGDKIEKRSIPAKECKFFTVNREGKLDPLKATDAATQLKQPTTVLTGFAAELAPGYLELIKPGTVYVVLPATNPSTVVPPPMPLPRGEKPRD